MQTIIETAKAAQESARRFFGDDIRITVARSKGFGHADSCLLVYGANHADVAASLIRMAPGATVEACESPAWGGLSAERYSAVSFA